VLGYKIGLLLVLVVLITPIASQSFADSILVEFDKSVYYTDDSITISGIILDFKMPVIGLSIYDPDGKILSANNVEINSDGIFSKTFSLDSPFYDKSGEYKVKLNYGKISQNEFFTMLGENLDSEIILTSPINPEIIFLYTDQTEYRDNDFITISGFVSDMGPPSILIGIYDPFGNPAGFYTEQINSNSEFSTSFLVKAGVNFKTDGTYSVKVRYGESEKSTIFNFNKEKIPLLSDNDLIEDDSIVKPVDSKTKPDPNDTKIKNTSDSSITNDHSIISNNNDSSLSKDNTKENTKAKSYETNMQSRKYNNLSVEDIELGKLLNQINLECDNNKFTDVISYYDGMGPALYRLCKFEQSLIFFDDSLIKDPNNVEILTNKGSSLGKLGRISESIIYYDKALQINPNFIPAINNKANALAKMGKYDQSLSLYTDAIEKNPDFQTARKNLTLMLSDVPSKSTILSVSQESLSKEIPSENLFQTEQSSKPQTEQSSKPQTEQSSNFFEEIGVVFSSLSSLFGFSN
jgi:tetratricopeptide (TPR) repeat protein